MSARRHGSERGRRRGGSSGAGRAQGRCRVELWAPPRELGMGNERGVAWQGRATDGELGGAATMLLRGSKAGEIGPGDGGAWLECAPCRVGETESTSTARCSAAANR